MPAATGSDLKKTKRETIACFCNAMYRSRMRWRVYVETSVVSYLTSRPIRDLLVAGHQQVTQEWWANHRRKLDLFVSQTVLEEIAAGDQESAPLRLSAIEELPLLEITEVAILPWRKLSFSSVRYQRERQ